MEFINSEYPKASQLRRLGTDDLLGKNYSTEEALPQSQREALEEKFQTSWNKLYCVCIVLFTMFLYFLYTSFHNYIEQCYSFLQRKALANKRIS